jgi:hypothetical protein
LSVAADTRNSKTVVLLIGSMTLGAALLLWFEPPVPGWSSTTLLMAESAGTVEDVQVTYVWPQAVIDPAAYDCLVLPSGECEWRPRDGRVRLAVIGSGADRLTDAQAETLLVVLGSLTQRHELRLDRVWLDPPSDARLYPDLPPEAHDLCELLVRKGIID